MKQVINISPPQDTIYLNEVLEQRHPIVGFQLIDQKTTLIPVSYGSDLYEARCTQYWEKGNFFSPDGDSAQSIKNWEIFFRTKHKAKMFVFDSPQELFKWLAK